MEIHRGDAPLVVSFPHTGIELPTQVAARLISPWLARKDADWWIEKLYDFAPSLGATTIRTAMSRTVIDVNRDPSGASLYPGQATTGLCPTTTFDGEPMYRAGEPDRAEIDKRRAGYFNPYHAALQAELDALRLAAPLIRFRDQGFHRLHTDAFSERRQRFVGEHVPVARFAQGARKPLQLVRE